MTTQASGRPNPLAIIGAIIAIGIAAFIIAVLAFLPQVRLEAALEYNATIIAQVESTTFEYLADAELIQYNNGLVHFADDDLNPYFDPMPEDWVTPEIIGRMPQPPVELGELAPHADKHPESKFIHNLVKTGNCNQHDVYYSIVHQRWMHVCKIGEAIYVLFQGIEQKTKTSYVPTAFEVDEAYLPKIISRDWYIGPLQ